jgi:hypothetical protein
MRGKKLAGVFAVLLATVAGGATVLGSPAAAATPATYTLQRGMNTTGFDAKVAAAHGYKIVTYADGSQQSVPVNASDKSKKPSAIVHPQSGVNLYTAQDTVYGDCGYSFIESDIVGTHKVNIRSGYKVKETSVYHGWSIYLSDNNGDSYQGNSGANASASWSKWWDNLTQVGSSFEEVRTSSYALLIDGEVCTSGGPYVLLYVS